MYRFDLWVFVAALNIKLKESLSFSVIAVQIQDKVCVGIKASAPKPPNQKQYPELTSLFIYIY